MRSLVPYSIDLYSVSDMMHKKSLNELDLKNSKVHVTITRKQGYQ